MSTLTITGPFAPPFGVGPWTNGRKRWTVDEFHDIYSLPKFANRKLVLLDGEILEMPNPNAPHDSGLGLAIATVTSLFGPGFWVRGQMALRLSQATDPMPDIAVVPGSPRDYPQQPTTALLVIEVSDSSVSIDTGIKAQLYAAVGIADYWVVDLNNKLVIVHRDPRPDPNSPHGVSYANVTSVTASQSVSPLAKAGSIVNVADLLP
ncbi:MAG TPA: Uma2 family endonuclease [Gemmataceae bacterium]|jgi:Uma2 family endonuclease|nr:Uma2 family endonuclease [Gemmataceae bacterium]